MKLIITQDNQVVAVVEDYQGPVPRRGEYIVRPHGQQPVPSHPDNVMCVQNVAWGIIARPANGEDHFVGAAEPFAEVTV